MRGRRPAAARRPRWPSAASTSASSPTWRTSTWACACAWPASAPPTRPPRSRATPAAARRTSSSARSAPGWRATRCCSWPRPIPLRWAIPVLYRQLAWLVAAARAGALREHVARPGWRRGRCWGRCGASATRCAQRSIVPIGRRDRGPPVARAARRRPSRRGVLSGALGALAHAGPARARRAAVRRDAAARDRAPRRGADARRPRSGSPTASGPTGTSGGTTGPASRCCWRCRSSCFGPSLLWWRIVRVVVDAVVALLAYKLIRRVTTNEPIALLGWLAAAGAMAWPATPSPNPIALPLVLAALLLARDHRLWAGALCGLAIVFRPEIGAAGAVAVALAGGGLGVAGARRGRGRGGAAAVLRGRAGATCGTTPSASSASRTCSGCRCALNPSGIGVDPNKLLEFWMPLILVLATRAVGRVGGAAPPALGAARAAAAGRRPGLPARPPRRVPPRAAVAVAGDRAGRGGGCRAEEGAANRPDRRARR